MDILHEMISAGILGGVLILALKSGLGCGLSDLKRMELGLVAGAYAIIAVIMGFAIGYIPLDLTEQVIGLGLLMHTAIGFGLIYAGIQTGKQWLCDHCDVSRRTFLWLSIPCPACLAATFFSCMILIETTGYAGYTIGGIIGAVFAGGVIMGAIAVHLVAGRFRLDRPAILGNVMLLLGLFYLVTPLIVFAYMKLESVPIVGTTVEAASTIAAIALMSGVILLGMMVERSKQMKRQGGE